MSTKRGFLAGLATAAAGAAAWSWLGWATARALGLWPATDQTWTEWRRQR